MGNKVSKRQWSGILLEFLPQLIFLLFLFGYLISMIFIKWFLYGANFGQKGSDDMQWSEHCAPNLLITFIGYLQNFFLLFGNLFFHRMMLFKKAEPDPKLDKCHVNGMNYELFMFPYQDTIQKALVVVAVMMIPIMLFGKPLVIIIIII